jgi:hypothetical protein
VVCLTPVCPAYCLAGKVALSLDFLAGLRSHLSWAAHRGGTLHDVTDGTGNIENASC